MKKKNKADKSKPKKTPYTVVRRNRAWTKILVTVLHEEWWQGAAEEAQAALDEVQIHACGPHRVPLIYVDDDNEPESLVVNVEPGKDVGAVVDTIVETLTPIVVRYCGECEGHAELLHVEVWQSHAVGHYPALGVLDRIVEATP